MTSAYKTRRLVVTLYPLSHSSKADKIGFEPITFTLCKVFAVTVFIFILYNIFYFIARKMVSPRRIELLSLGS